MGRPRTNGERVSTAVRIPVEVHERLTAAADERDVSVNYLVTKALRRYLDAMPRLQDDEDLA